MLQLCVSQKINKTPFLFKSTGIKVYSFEEAIYHVFHNWRESVDDFLSDGMIKWVGEIGHSLLASKMKELRTKEPFSTRLLGFLGLVEYFHPTEISALTPNLEAWELRREWEKLKERADSLVNRGEPDKAITLYQRALKYEENPALLNNMGVAYLQTSAPNKAMRQLARAMSIDPKNLEIQLHYIEAAILSRNYEPAKKAIASAKAKAPELADIPFFEGLIAYQQKSYVEAITQMGRAIELDPSLPLYVYKLADVYIATRQFERAIETLQAASPKDAGFFAKEAELYASSGDIPAAIKSMEKAVEFSPAPNATLLANLASLHRQNYDLAQAEATIKQALETAADNEHVQLENARIKRGLGRTREYQAALGDVILNFKKKYREN
ncbi:MAG: tetratricopeptide repeat protein [Defluviitaleaceae bacterium]|nr:tetratricopeptide repeat protein [Defluviitaleaceae bacterium]